MITLFVINLNHVTVIGKVNHTDSYNKTFILSGDKYHNHLRHPTTEQKDRQINVRLCCAGQKRDKRKRVTNRGRY